MKVPVFTVPVHEFNSCHLPGGRPDGGQFCSKEEAVGAFPEGEYDPARDAEYRAYWDREKDWDRKMTHAVSLGRIDPEAAKKLGWRPDSNAEKGYEPLPDTLYHVSTAYNAILLLGLKTRAEIGGVHRGLGGGTEDTVSFTTDLETARSIRSAILEARRVVRGELTPETMWRMALAQPERLVAETPRAKYMQSQGAVNAAEMLANLYLGKTGWKRGDPLPDNLDRVLRGVKVESPGDSKHPALQAAVAQARAEGVLGLGAIPARLLPPGMKAVSQWEGRSESFVGYVERPMTRDERLDAAFEMYKRFAMAREYAGGRMDPLFFLTDREALAEVKVKDIKIMRFKPRRGARGYRVSSLGEWRINTGQAVKYDGLVESA